MGKPTKIERPKDGNAAGTRKPAALHDGETGSSSPNRIVDEVTALNGLGEQALRIAWARHFRCPAPPIRSADTLRRLYAWKAQAEAFGGLDAEATKLLGRARTLVRKGKSPVGAIGPLLRPGTILVREWRGTMHRVLVLDKSFEHDGQRYRTLSEAARAITGTNWSGPRFFGLTDDAKLSPPAAADSEEGDR